MKEKCGVIYILTNPSFPEYIKIGYADDVEARVKQLNNSEAVPFSFHIYATFDVTERLTDIKLHKFIDTINLLLAYLGKECLSIYILSTYIYDGLLPLFTKNFTLNYFVAVLQSIVILLISLAIMKIIRQITNRRKARK